MYYFVLHVVRSEFGVLAKCQLCCGDLAKSQMVLQIEIRTTEQTRQLADMVSKGSTAFCNKRVARSMIILLYTTDRPILPQFIANEVVARTETQLRHSESAYGATDRRARA
jgi:hypothetical protein